MIKRFECELCEEVFSSAYEMAQHFRSEEHRKKGDIGNLDMLTEKFVSGLKADLDEAFFKKLKAEDVNDKPNTV